MARNRFIILIILSTASILACMYLLNSSVLSIRMMELEGYLKGINRETSQADELDMVSKYRLHLRLYKEAIDEKKFDEEELDTFYLAASFEARATSSRRAHDRINLPLLAIMNALRWIIGKPPIETVTGNSSDDELTLAYYFERNRNYKKALSIYASAISEKKVTEGKIPIVLLHEGYCRSLLSEYDAAKSIFLSIIKDYSNENIAMTAALMLQYLETLRSEVNKVKESGGSGIEKSEKLYRLIAYQDAVEVLSKITPQNDREADKIAYLSARCLEETGKTGESAKKYQELVERDPHSELAQLANRRLVVMSSVDEKDKRLLDLAAKNNERVSDDGFASLADTARKTSESRKAGDAAYKKRIASELSKSNEDSASKTGRTQDIVNTETNQGLDSFIDDSIASAEHATDNTVKATDQIESPSTPSPGGGAANTPTPAPNIRAQTSRPDIKSTAEPGRTASSQTAEPGKPFTKDYKDVKGNVYKTEVYDERGNLEKTILYEFDAKGKPTKIKVYDKNGVLLEN
jgi:tetratricopeptide (TPR) repeat protein